MIIHSQQNTTLAADKKYQETASPTKQLALIQNGFTEVIS